MCKMSKSTYCLQHIIIIISIRLNRVLMETGNTRNLAK